MSKECEGTIQMWHQCRNQRLHQCSGCSSMPARATGLRALAAVSHTPPVPVGSRCGQNRYTDALPPAYGKQNNRALAWGHGAGRFNQRLLIADSIVTTWILRKHMSTGRQVPASRTLKSASDGPKPNAESKRLTMSVGGKGRKFALLVYAQQVVDMIVYRRDAGHALEDDPSIQRLDIHTLEAAAVPRQTIPEDQQLALIGAASALMNSTHCAQ